MRGKQGEPHRPMIPLTGSADDGKRSEVLCTNEVAVRGLLLFQKSYIEREVWRERVVILTRMGGWRMTGSAFKAMDVVFQSGSVL